MKINNFNKFLMMTLVICSGLNPVLALAKNKKIYCHSARKERIFVLDGEQVAFFNFQDGVQNFRAIASVSGTPLKRVNHTLTKNLFLEGREHQIFIKDETQFNEADDFIQITSKEGHRMTYPLSCQNL
jgi:hypothetical protein